MKNLIHTIIILVLLSGIPQYSLLRAQNSDSTIVSDQGNDSKTFLPVRSDTIFLPSRGNHIFTSISSVNDPFVSTKFLLGFGVAEIIETEIPVTIAGTKDTTIKFEPDIFYATGGAEFQYAVRNWAAVNIKISGLARMGNNFLSLASQGVSAASNFSIGWLFRIAENEDVMFSGSIALNTADIAVINVLSRADTITTVDTLIYRQIISNYQSLTTQADLRFAARFSDVVGILTRLSGGFGEAYAAESEGKFNYNFGLALSFDLRNWFSIPFGVGIGGSIISNDWQFNNSKPPIYSGNINIAFYNRNDFTIGVENYLSFIQSEQLKRTINYLYTRLYMSYYF